jgi:hypothetical protein
VLLPTKSNPAPTAVNPSPSTGAPVCLTLEIDPTSFAQPGVIMVPAGERVVAGQDGLAGGPVVDGPPGDWHQPDPLKAVVARPGQLLFVGSPTEDERAWFCLRAITADAAPFSPVAASPPPSALVRLASARAGGPGVAVFTVLAPDKAGEWVVRVLVTLASRPNPIAQESFFRLRIGVPAPPVGGTARRPVGCGRPGIQPPVVTLSVDGGRPLPGASGTTTWRNSEALVGGEPIGPRVEAGPDSRLVVVPQGNVCAGWWRIVLAPRPPTTEGALYLEPLADLVPPRLNLYGVPPARANRFVLAPVPSGDWVIRATLDFVDERGAIVGSTNTYWNLVVR